MRKIELDKKTGFKITNPKVPVIIRDFRGIEFYNNSELYNRTAFNIPAGTYFVERGEFVPLKNPVIYSYNKLPDAERNFPDPFNFKIDFKQNPNKATIDWRKKEIIIDESFRGAPLPVLYFMLFHEFAHGKYENETLVDRLAENMMIAKGFNPSQTAKALITTLSQKQYNRKLDSLNRNIYR